MNDIDRDPPPFWRSRGGLALLVVAAVGGFFLLTEHRAHVLGSLPYAFLLACPLVHMFMHHGHHRHGSHGHTGRTGDEHPDR
jgi:hypothetical protein